MSHHIPLVVHVVYRLDIGGLENGIVNLINRMPDDRFRHAIICLTDHTDFSSRIKKPLKIIDLHKKPGQDIGLYFRLWRVFRQLRPDIVHTRNLATLEAQLPAFLLGIKGRIHGEHGRDIHDLDNTNWKYRWLRIFFRFLVKRYIALSHDLGEYLTRDVGVSSDRLDVITNGVDSLLFSPPIDQCKDKNSNGTVSHVFGTVGRLEEVKGHEYLIDAVNILRQSSPLLVESMRVIIVGNGSLRKHLEEKARECGLNNVFSFYGARDDVVNVLHEMDVFVLPSLAEGISNTILEAMSCGLPVIATNVGGNPELVSEGETGTLVDRCNPSSLAEAMASYLISKEKIQYQGKKARERILSEFSMQSMVTSYMKVYGESISST